MKNEGVNIWEEKVVIPTYGVGKPNKNPMFFEKRIYQGSSGVVYPNPVIEKILDQKEDKEYTGLFLENRYIRIMILPELGGRIQMAYDKIKERHFIYYNQVIKPALVGLTGPWISGGIEFNWPQHHRPSTYETVDYRLEEHQDGSKTVWINEVERMFGTKGMAGFTIYPDIAYLEIKAQLFNRTNLPQTFLWWANPAVKVNDDYQSVFPPDVNAVFDHGKRDVSSFPIATGTYYKVDYSPGTDISRYRNIPVPTSYMAVNSAYDFMGGYEHDTQGGVLHVANHHISPGKKQWTWGHSDFGKAWDRNLTDEDGPYIELMTGMFTDNQPDFSWLMPYEEKSFTQYFLPYRELGMVKNATKDILLSIEKQEEQVNLKIQVTSKHQEITILLTEGDQIVFKRTTDLSPEDIFSQEIEVLADADENKFILTVINENGTELIRYEPANNTQNEIPETAKAALSPEETETTEALFLTGQHLEQYRHATFSPVPYYEEALKRDPKDLRNNNALGVWYLRRGQFEKAEPFFRRAIETAVSRNPNPYDGEPYYNLGLCLKYQERTDEAYKAFYKATWSSAWQDSAYFSLAQIDLIRGDQRQALEHIEHAINRNACNSRAYVIKAAALRKLGMLEKGSEVYKQGILRDGFNLGLWFEKYLCLKKGSDHEAAADICKAILKLSRGTAGNLLAYASDYADCGQFDEAAELLALIPEPNLSAMVYYYSAYFYHRLNKEENAKAYLILAASADSYLCFPNRIEDIRALKYAAETNEKDAKAPYYSGNLWYDKRQYANAINDWELSLSRDTRFPTVLRNLGIAAYNKQNNAVKAREYFERAFESDTSDARVLMELDQLYKRLQKKPEERLDLLEQHMAAVLDRDDLYLELVTLNNFLGQHEKAYDLIMQRKFHPWEGGEGKVSGQYLVSLVEMARQHMAMHEYPEAISRLNEALVYPHNLGEGKLFGMQENDIYYWLGISYEGMMDKEKAANNFKKAGQGSVALGAALFYNDQQPEKIFYKGLALMKLGNLTEAETLFKTFIEYGQANIDRQVTIDYFAVSLPDLMIFDDNLNTRNRVHCHYIKGLGYLGLNETEKASHEFSCVLDLDNSHWGAKQHMMIYKDPI